MLVPFTKRSWSPWISGDSICQHLDSGKLTRDPGQNHYMIGKNVPDSCMCIYIYITHFSRQKPDLMARSTWEANKPAAINAMALLMDHPTVQTQNYSQTGIWGVPSHLSKPSSIDMDRHALCKRPRTWQEQQKQTVAPRTFEPIPPAETCGMQPAACNSESPMTQNECCGVWDDAAMTYETQIKEKCPKQGKTTL